MEKTLYILTYDHGGFVLWGDEIEKRLDKVAGWFRKYPEFKLGLDYEAFTFDEMSRIKPEFNSKISEMMKEFKGRFGLGSTTYGQPLSLYISDESNVRQLTYAIKSNLEHFGTTPSVYAVSEFALNNQLPQLLIKCGYKAVLMRTHVMNFGYQKDFDSAFGIWRGDDGTEIPAIPTYKGAGVGYTNCTLDNWILTRWPGDSQYSLDDFIDRFGKYEPLLASRYDDISNGKEELIADCAEKKNRKFVLLDELPDIYGKPSGLLPTDCNDFHGRMPWGYCGNSIFNRIRKAETQAESADVLASFCKALGGQPDTIKLTEAWKNVLVAQHHDVTICGLLKEADRFTSDSLGDSESVCSDSVDFSAQLIGESGTEGFVVFNPDSSDCGQWVDTGFSADYSAYSGSRRLMSENRGGRLFAYVEIPGLSAVKIETEPEESKRHRMISYNGNTGILQNDLYKIKLNSKGICYIELKNGKRMVDNGKGALFRGYVSGSDCESEGEWQVWIRSFTVLACYTGKIGNIPFRFEMEVDSLEPQIKCSAEFDMNNERVGRTGITKGIHTDYVVNGSVHEEKIRFVMNLCVDSSRKMSRDLPFMTADWDQQICEPEEFWYEGKQVLADHKVDSEKAFGSPVYLQGINWASVYDNSSYAAVLNRGCMGNAVEGNTLSVPLIYSNEYMCGTRILKGTYRNEFALLFGNEYKPVEIHRRAKSYNHPFIVGKAYSSGGGENLITLARAESEAESVIITDVSPADNGLSVRVCNYSGERKSFTLSVYGCTSFAETDLLGNIICEEPDFSIGGHEIKTFICC